MHRDELHIPEPCHADWNRMEPRAKARFCAECSIEVIDVSAYSEPEARELATRPRPTRVCMSYVVRADGTIRFAEAPAPARLATTNAPDVPLRALTRRGRTMVAAATLALAACQPISDASQALFGAELPVLAERRLAGEPVAIPQPPPPPTGPDAGTGATLGAAPEKPERTAGADTPAAPCAPEGSLSDVVPEYRLSGGVSAIRPHPTKPL